MSSKNFDTKQFDHWLVDGSNVAALVMHQWLRPVDEIGLADNEKAVIFPPTYAKPRGVQDKEWTGYNIDRFKDGSSVCLIDSVGSQANRMEPVFKSEKYKQLVPQVVIRAGEHNIHILDAGHRAGDAIVRFAGNPKREANGKDATESAKEVALGKQIWDAFVAWQKHGNAEPLAKIAPTSLVFGVWDSRATQAKLPRIVRSVIRAYDVKPHTRSATFNTPRLYNTTLKYVNEGLIDEKHDKGEGDKNPLSQEGFLYSLASKSHGGVEVVGDIRRDASINLVALRTLGVTPKEEEDARDADERVLKLRRYVLGIALVALTHRSDQQFNLREGCLLRISRSSAWKAVLFEGDEEDISIKPKEALNFAREAAACFKVQQFDKPFMFDQAKAEKWMRKNKKDRDKLRRTDAVINQGL